MAEFKVAMVGGGGVGKSALAIRFAHDQFIEAYDPTIEDNYRKQLTFDDDVCVLEIQETSDGATHSEMRRELIWFCHGFVCVYAVNGPTSFDELDGLCQDVLRIKGQDSVPMVLVANKCDLESERVVLAAEGKALADRYGLPFFEASAKTGANAFEPFISLARQMRSIPPSNRERKQCLFL